MRETTVYRNVDVDFEKHLHVRRRIPVEMNIEETTSGFRLTMQERDGDRGTIRREQSIEVTVPKEPARNAQQALDNVRRQLSKLGDTPYILLRDVRVEWQQPYFLPAGQLNAWRRALVEEMTKEDLRMTHAKCRMTNDEKQTATTADTFGQNDCPDEVASLCEQRPLMTCRYCILHEMGHCRKLNPLKKEPKYMRLRNGMKVRLQFDCARCEMTIWAV